MTLADAALKGDRLALARLLTQVENGTPDGRTALRALFAQTGRAHLIGITGAPGTGKSSLVNRLTMHFHGHGKRVAIIAVDPSSPFSGGAVLGDRVRMKDLANDEDVFIRSMASRGTLGGLARGTADLAQIFDAVGYDIILIETVGAGQGEVDIARLAHTTLVVEAPGLGDDIQAIKAGILEIADILVINKADRPGVENTEKALRSVLQLAGPMQDRGTHHAKSKNVDVPEPLNTEGWDIPLHRTVSTDGQGIPELAQLIEKHLAYLRSSNNWSTREGTRLISEVSDILQETLLAEFHARLPEGRYNELMNQVKAKRLSPWEAVSRMVDGGGKDPSAAGPARVAKTITGRRRGK